MGSFESWAATMGGILEVAGVPGFLENRQEVYAQAEAENTAWRTFIDIWAGAYDTQNVDTDKLFDLATQYRLLTDLRSGRTDHGARVSMGIHLMKLRDRMLGGHVIRFVGHGPDGKRAMYTLEETPG